MPIGRWPDTVDCVSLLRGIQESGLSWGETARRTGINERQLARMLGRSPTWTVKDGKKYGPYWQKGVSPRNALRIAKALGLDPVDLGF